MPKNKNNIENILEEYDKWDLIIEQDVIRAFEGKPPFREWLKQKLQQVEEHETENGYCCACEYDIACMNEKIDIAVQRKVEEVRKEIEKICKEGMCILCKGKVSNWNCKQHAMLEILNLKSLKTKK